MDAAKKEYTSFGPWLIEIKNTEDIPPQFISEKEFIMGANYAVKVPRNIDTKTAKVGMLLYNFVITLFDDKIVIIERSENSIKSIHINYSDIQYIQYINNLLFGQLTLVWNNLEYSLEFNPISYEIINHIIHTIREHYNKPEVHVKLNTVAIDATVDSYDFRNILLQEFGNHNYKIIAYQPFISLSHQNTSPLIHISEMVKRPMLQESLFLSDGKELIILNRVKEVKKERDIDYGIKKTFIPLTNIDSVSTCYDDKLLHLKNLELKMDKSVLQVKVGTQIKGTNLRKLISEL